MAGLGGVPALAAGRGGAAACAAAAAAAAACAPVLAAPPEKASRVWGESPPAPCAHWVFGAKVYSAEPAPVLSFLRARTLGLALLRHGLLNFAPLLERWAEALRDQELEWERRRSEGEEVGAEEDLEWPPFPDHEPAAHAAAQGVAWEGLVTTTRRLLEHVVAARVPPRLAWKLLKNVPESAVRKSRRFMAARRGAGGTRALAAAMVPWELGGRGWGSLAGYCGAVCRATARGNGLGYLAEFLARGALDTYLVFLRPLPGKAPMPPLKLKVWALARCAAGNAASIFVCLACASTCTAVGALVGEALLGGRGDGVTCPPAEGGTRFVGTVLPAYAAFALGDMLGAQLARPLVTRLRGAPPAL